MVFLKDNRSRREMKDMNNYDNMKSADNMNNADNMKSADNIKEVTIVPADAGSDEGARLNSMALSYMAYSLIGSKDSEVIDDTMKKLWSQKENRFSHEYAYEAKLDGRTVGIITCYSHCVMERLAWPTFKELLKTRKWELVKHIVGNIKESLSMFLLKEGRNGEFHIGSIATLPECRGYGVGTKLIEHAEAYARKKKFRKCSLTVKMENEGARKLYERLGYEVVDFIDMDPFHLYRMVKVI